MKKFGLLIDIIPTVPLEDSVIIDYKQKPVHQTQNSSSITLNDYIKTKNDQWAYEQEQRFIVDICSCEKDSKGLYFFDFKRKWAITKIYSGLRSSDKLEEIKSLCKDCL